MLNNSILRGLFITLSSVALSVISPLTAANGVLNSPEALPVGADLLSVLAETDIAGDGADDAGATTDLWQRIRPQLSIIETVTAESGTRRIAEERSWYIDNPQYLTRVSSRSTPYLHYVVEEIERRDMPMELALLPIMESAYDPFAYSHGRAAGLWQIIPGTGRELGLTQDWWYDGRRDLQDSTDAALNYLTQLSERFDGDWLKALAAYNAGPGRVSRAEKRNRAKGLSTDFWSLKLPRETRAYVPRLLALAELVAEPDRYGQSLTGVSNHQYFDTVDIGGQIELSRAAELAGIELGELQRLNPGYNRWATSPQGPHQLLVPATASEHFSAALASLTSEDRVQWTRYRVARGDTLISIARSHGTRVDVLRSINDIPDSRIIAGDTLMIPSAPTDKDLAALNGASMMRKVGYRVRSGDSLARIAGKFNLTVDDILGWNQELRNRKYIHPGQRLTLYVDITGS